MLAQHPRMQCEEIDALPGLLLDLAKNVIVCQRFDGFRSVVPADHHLVYRHRPERDRRVSDQTSAALVGIPTGRKVHHRVRTVLDRRAELFEFVRCRGLDG